MELVSGSSWDVCMAGMCKPKLTLRREQYDCGNECGAKPAHVPALTAIPEEKDTRHGDGRPIGPRFFSVAYIHTIFLAY